MNFKEATRNQLIEIAYHDMEISLSTKAEALAELLRRNRTKIAFNRLLQCKVRRKRA
jgi:hypothetical protein